MTGGKDGSTYLKGAWLLDTDLNAVINYPGGNMNNARAKHGSVLVELKDKSRAILVIGGYEDFGGGVKKRHPAEKSIVDLESGTFGPWIVDKSIDLIHSSDFSDTPICRWREKRAFCFKTYDDYTIQEFVPWQIPPWRILDARTDKITGPEEFNVLILYS